MAPPFDDEETLDTTARCFYRLDLGAVLSADAARARRRGDQRAREGRRLRPHAEHVLVAQSPDGMAQEVRAELLPAVGNAFDESNVTAYPSWLTENARLVPERATPPEESWRRISSAFEATTSLTGVRSRGSTIHTFVTPSRA